MTLGTVLRTSPLIRELNGENCSKRRSRRAESDIQEGVNGVSSEALDAGPGCPRRLMSDVPHLRIQKH